VICCATQLIYSRRAGLAQLAPLAACLENLNLSHCDGHAASLAPALDAAALSVLTGEPSTAKW